MDKEFDYLYRDNDDDLKKNRGRGRKFVYDNHYGTIDTGAIGDARHSYGAINMDEKQEINSYGAIVLPESIAKAVLNGEIKGGMERPVLSPDMLLLLEEKESTEGKTSEENYLKSLGIETPLQFIEAMRVNVIARQREEQEKKKSAITDAGSDGLAGVSQVTGSLKEVADMPKSLGGKLMGKGKSLFSSISGRGKSAVEEATGAISGQATGMLDTAKGKAMDMGMGSSLAGASQVTGSLKEVADMPKSLVGKLKNKGKGLLSSISGQGKSVLEDAKGAISGQATGMLNSVQEKVTDMSSGIAGVSQTAGSLKEIANTPKSLVGKLKSKGKGFLSSISGQGKSAVEDITGSISGQATGVLGAATGKAMGSGLTGVSQATGSLKGIADTPKSLIGKLKSKGKGMLSSGKSAVEDAKGAISGQATGMLDGVVGKVKGIGSGLTDKALDGLPDLDNIPGMGQKEEADKEKSTEKEGDTKQDKKARDKGASVEAKTKKGNKKPTGGGSAAGAGGSAEGGGNTGGGSDGGGTASITAPDLDTSSSKGYMDSLAASKPSAFALGVSQAGGVVPGIQENEKSELKESLPEIEQPTGLETKERKGKKKETLKKGGKPDIKTKGKDKPESKIEKEHHQPGSKPDVSKASAPKVAAKVEGEDESSWIAKAIQSMKTALSALPTKDKTLATKAGERPVVDTTGSADPLQNEDNQTTSDATATVEHAKADKATTSDFGENDVFPDIKPEMLSPETELSTSPDFALNNIEGLNIPTEVPADMLAAFDEEVQTKIDEERNKQIEEYAKKHTEKEENSIREREKTDVEITKKTEEAKATQEKEQEKAKGDVEGYRKEWQEENQNIKNQYDESVKSERIKTDKGIVQKIEETDQKVEDELSTAESQAANEKTKIEAQAAQEKQKVDDQSKNKSWWEKAGDAVSSFFEGLKAKLDSLFSKLRSFVKTVIEAAKKIAVALINLARDVIINLIKAFGEVLKVLVNVVLVAFPKLAAKINGFIDKVVEVACAAVNKIAEVLKAGVCLLLDMLGRFLDFALNTLQTAFNLALDILANLAKMVLELAHYFFDMIISTVMKITTLAALTGLIIGGFLLTIAWDFLPEGLRNKALDFILDKAIVLLESAPDDMRFGVMWSVFVNMMLGLLQTAKSFGSDEKKKIMETASNILNGNDSSFVWEFIKNIFVGIWENIWGLITGIGAILKFFFWDLPKFQFMLLEKLVEIAPDIADAFIGLVGDVKNIIVLFKEEGPDAIEKLANSLSIDKILEFLNGVGNKIRTKSAEIGSKIASEGRALVLSGTAGAVIGKKLGYFTGYILVEVALMFFTAGIGSAIKWGINAISKIKKGIQLVSSAKKASGLQKVIGAIFRGFRWLFNEIKQICTAFWKVGKEIMAAIGRMFKNFMKKVDDILVKLKSGNKADDVANKVDDVVEAAAKGSKRLQYLGRTPGKASKTGREVFERMSKEIPPTARIKRGVKQFYDPDNKMWRNIDQADMGHIDDAVTWWNKTGRKFGPKSKEVREWMLDSKNYVYQYYKTNRSKGAILGTTTKYLPPL